MSIDMSSMIPVFSTTDVKIKKEDASHKVRAVEGSTAGSHTDLELNKERYPETGVRDNYEGVGDTYNTQGALLRDRAMDMNGDNKYLKIDMMI